MPAARSRVVLAAGAALLLAGCAAVSPDAAPSDPEPTPWHVSLPETAHSLPALRASATLVVLGRAVENTPFVYQDLPFTTTTLRITEVLDGTPAEGKGPLGTVAVRQFGDAHNHSEELAPVMLPGGDYLAFLFPFEMTPGDPTGEYAVVGAGIWAKDEAGIYRLPAEAAELSDLPETLAPVDAIG